MAVSSNTLIHLTLKKESLFGILKEGFKVKYCHETIFTKTGTINAAFPMVSFSDLPLSELYYHIESYGNYGIGLKKEWAQRNGLNPVLYFDDSSVLGSIIRSDFEEIYRNVNDGKLDSRIYETINSIQCYMKNYQGLLNTSKISRENYRFSDEREWRYVPTKDELNGAASMINPLIKVVENEKLEHLRLKFEPDDINYLFVEDEKELEEVIEIIRIANATKSYSSVERLMTRILTTYQIKTDF